MRKVDPCPCARAVLAHDPEEYAQATAFAGAALVITAASKITNTKTAFQIFQPPCFSGRYAISSFKGFIPKFYCSGDRGGTVSRSKFRLRVARTSTLLYWGANLEQGATCTRTGGYT